MFYPEKATEVVRPVIEFFLQQTPQLKAVAICYLTFDKEVAEQTIGDQSVVGFRSSEAAFDLAADLWRLRELTESELREGGAAFRGKGFIVSVVGLPQEVSLIIAQLLAKVAEHYWDPIGRVEISFKDP